MGQKKRDRTTLWRQERLVKLANEHCRQLREDWKKRQEESEDGDSSSKSK